MTTEITITTDLYAHYDWLVEHNLVNPDIEEWEEFILELEIHHSPADPSVGCGEVFDIERIFHEGKEIEFNDAPDWMYDLAERSLL